MYDIKSQVRLEWLRIPLRSYRILEKWSAKRRRFSERRDTTSRRSGRKMASWRNCRAWTGRVHACSRGTHSWTFWDACAGSRWTWRAKSSAGIASLESCSWWTAKLATGRLRLTCTYYKNLQRLIISDITMTFPISVVSVRYQCPFTPYFEQTQIRMHILRVLRKYRASGGNRIRQALALKLPATCGPKIHCFVTQKQDKCCPKCVKVCHNLHALPV